MYATPINIYTHVDMLISTCKSAYVHPGPEEFIMSQQADFKKMFKYNITYEFT